MPLNLQKFLNVLLVGFLFYFISFTAFSNNPYYIDKDVLHSEKIIQALNETKSLDADVFHVFTHGKPGELLINGEWVDPNGIADFIIQQFKGNHYSSIQIYGCNFAKGLKGIDALHKLERMIKSSVSASNDVTGKNGDWDLEEGNISYALKIDNYPNNLQCTTSTKNVNRTDDFDGDGICNDVDLDSDNDGVLDEDEICPPVLNRDTVEIYEDGIPGGSTSDSDHLYLAVNNNYGTLQMDAQGINWDTQVDMEVVLAQEKDITSGFLFESYHDWGGDNFEGIDSWQSLKFYDANDDLLYEIGPINNSSSNPNASKISYYNSNYNNDANAEARTNLIPKNGDVISNNIISILIDQNITGIKRYVMEDIVPLPTNLSGSDLTVRELNLSSESFTDCFLDTDGDGFPNKYDLDSDGDGCSDAIESGATNDETTNYQFPYIDSNGDGLVDAVDPANDGMTDYTSTYDSRALDSLNRSCCPLTDPRIIMPNLKICGEFSQDLNELVDDNINDPNVELNFSTSPDSTLVTARLSNPVVTEEGVYYVYYYDSYFDCYSNVENISITMGQIDPGLITSVCNNVDELTFFLNINKIGGQTGTTYSVIHNGNVIQSGLNYGTNQMVVIDGIADGIDDVIRVQDSDENNCFREVTVDDPGNCEMPSIELLKTSELLDDIETDNIAQMGETVRYTFTVKNTGDVPLTDVKIIDPVLGLDPPNGLTVSDLAINGQQILTFDYIIKQSDLDEGQISNSGEAMGTSPEGTIVIDKSDSDENTGDDDDPTITPFAPEMPSINLEKIGVFQDDGVNQQGTAESGAGDGVVQPGETIVYTFNYQNTGNVKLENILFSDGRLGVIDMPLPDLTANETGMITITYTILESDITGGVINNTADIIGETPGMVQVSDDASFSINLSGEESMITLVKTGTFLDDGVGVNNRGAADGIAQIGETIIYSFEVCNTGNVDLFSIEIDDARIGLSNFEVNGGTISSNAAMNNCVTVNNIEYHLTQSDINSGMVMNIATVNAVSPSGTNVNDSDNELIPDLNGEQPEISIDKSGVFNDEGVGVNNAGAGDGIGQEGESLTYNMLICNEGNVLLTDVTLDDQELGITNLNLNDLTVEGSTRCTTIVINREITMSDDELNSLLNSAQVLGVSPQGTEVEDFDEEFLEFPAEQTDIKITKTGMWVDDGNGDVNNSGFNDGVAQIGETISYQFEICNEGNSELNNVYIRDSRILTEDIIVGILPAMSCQTLMVEYTLKNSDINVGNGNVQDSIENQARVFGMTPGGIQIVDSSDDGDDTDGNIIDDKTVVVFPVEQPKISLIKTAVFLDDISDDDVAQLGEKIQYTFVVCNESNVFLDSVRLNDAILGIEGSIVMDLEPNECETVIYDYPLDQIDIDNEMVENSAVVGGNTPDNRMPSAVSDDGNSANGSANPTVLNFPTENPHISLIKEGVFLDNGVSSGLGVNDGVAQVGETIEYTFTICNEGNVPLDEIRIKDDKIRTSTGTLDTTLSNNILEIAGEGRCITLIVNYTLRQIDIINSGVSNMAIGYGTSPGEEKVSDFSDDGSPLEDDNTDIEFDTELPCISLVKTAEINLGFDGMLNAGDRIEYTYIAENCGNVTLSNVKVTENSEIFDGNGIPPIVGDVMPMELNVNETGVASAYYILNQDDLDQGFVNNRAKAEGVSPSMTMVIGESMDDSGFDETTVTLEQDACISLLKSSVLDFGFDDPGTPTLKEDTIANAGDEVLYRFTIANCGNVTIDNIELTDPLPNFTGNGTLDVASLNTTLDGKSLMPGENIILSVFYTLVQQDIDQKGINNQALVTGKEPNGTTVSDESESTNPGDGQITSTSIDRRPCIELIKTARVSKGDDDMVTAGDTVYYDYNILNCGNTTIYDLQVVEDMNAFSGDDERIPIPTEVATNPLLPWIETFARGFYVLDQSDIDGLFLKNQALAIGQTLDGESVVDISDAGNTPDSGTDQDTTSFMLDQQPCIEVFKSSELSQSNPEVVLPGDEILYAFEIVNCGNVTLLDVSLSDISSNFTGQGELPVPESAMFPLISPGDSMLTTASYTIVQQDIDNGGISNRATARGSTPTTDEEVEDDSDSKNENDDTGRDDDRTFTEIKRFECSQCSFEDQITPKEKCFESPGDVIVYSFTVENCGNTVINNYGIDVQQFSGSQIEIPQLESIDPNTQRVINIEYVITEQDINSGGVTFNSQMNIYGNDTILTQQEKLSFIRLSPRPPILVCNTNVQISLDSNCSGVKPSDLLETTILRSFKIEIEDENGKTYTLFAEDSQSQFTDQNGDPFDWSPLIGQTIRYKLIRECDGDSCWGDARIEVNQIPSLQVDDCAYIPGFKFVDTVSITENGMSQFMLNYRLDPCQLLTFNIDDREERYSCAVNDDLGGVVAQDIPSDGWCYRLIKINSDLTGYSGEKTITLNITSQGITDPYHVIFDVEVSECVSCISWNGAIPEGIVTEEEVEKMVEGECFENIQSLDLVETMRDGLDSQGDVCGQTIIREWEVQYELHGEKQNTTLFAQAYRLVPIAIDLYDLNSDSEPNAGQIVPPPSKVVVDCDGNTTATENGAGIPIYLNPHAKAEPKCVEIHINYTKIDKIIDQKINIGTATDQIWAIVPVVIKKDTVAVFCSEKNYCAFLNQASIDAQQPVGPGKIYSIQTTLEDIQAVDQLHDWSTVRCDDDIDGWPVDRDDIRMEKLSGPEFHNLRIQYTDSEFFESCGNGLKFIRKWEVFDVCTNSIESFTQIIEKSDRQGPKLIKFAKDTIVVGLSPWVCTLDPTHIILPEFYSNCSDFQLNQEIYNLDGVLISDVGIGIFEVVFTATNDCGKSTIQRNILKVVDKVAPVAVCDPKITVSLIHDPNKDGIGTAKVYANSIDIGSHDFNCGNVQFGIRRTKGCCFDECEHGALCIEKDKYGTCIAFDSTLIANKFKEYVSLCCQDVGQEIDVELKIVDDQGNYTTCNTKIEVFDKSIEQCINNEVIVDCLDDLKDLELPKLEDSHCLSSSLLFKDEGIVGSCGEGEIIRSFYFDKDDDGQISSNDKYGCQTIIQFVRKNAFDPHSIKFPKHFDGGHYLGINLECNENSESIKKDHVVNMPNGFECDVENPNIEPIWCAPECGLIVSTVDTKESHITDACKKIIYSWTVIDWCLYKGNGEEEKDSSTDSFEAVEDWSQGECSSCDIDEKPIGDNPVYFRYNSVEIDGYYTFDQVVNVIDENPPIINVPDTVIVEIDFGSENKTDNNICSGSMELIAVGSDYCHATLVEDSKLLWSIDVLENGELIETIKGRGDNVVLDAPARGPGSEIEVSWTLKDGCGNVSIYRTIIQYKDVKPPVPLCLSGLTTSLVDSVNGGITFWATDLDVGGFDNCTAQENLIYGVIEKGTEFDENKMRNGDYSSINFTCEKHGNDPVKQLILYVGDKNGNYGNCGLSVIFNTNNCVTLGDNHEDDARASIFGYVRTEFGLGVDNVEISVTKESNKNGELIITDSLGNYVLNGMKKSDDYIIKPRKVYDNLNGISNFDILILRRYLLELGDMTSAYSIIAGDVNNDSKISSNDIIELRRSLLGINDKWKNNDAWRFVSEKEQFFDYENPWPFTEELAMKSISDFSSHNFIGVKIGDVDGSSMKLPNVESRNRDSKKRFAIKQIDRNECEISILSSETIYGIQMELSVGKDIELKEIKSSGLLLEKNNVFYDKKKKVLRIIWDDVQGVEVNNGAPLFTLIAHNQIEAQNWEISHTMWESSIISEENIISDLELDIIGVEESQLNIIQNEPNPFNDLTNIGIELDKDQVVNLEIYTTDGRRVYQWNERLLAGPHTIQISKKDLGNTPGIYFYRLSNSDTFYKMVLIE